MTDQFERARALVLEHQKASTSWLQRQLRIGYNEAARYIERMQASGDVSAPDHVGRRDVLRPPSATLPEATVHPWNRNEGKFDVPSSSVPTLAIPHGGGEAKKAKRARKAAAVAAPAEIDEGVADEASEIETLAEALVERFGVADAAMLVDAIREARALKDAASAPPGCEPAVAHLFQIVERAELLFEQRAALAATITDLFKFANELGFNSKAIRACIQARALHPDLRKMQEAELEVYRAALGIEGPEVTVVLPTVAPPSAKTVPAVGPRARAMALAALSKQALQE